MIAWGTILSSDQITQLVAYLRSLPAVGTTPEPGSFSAVAPLLQSKCVVCHNDQTQLGGWDASSYESVMTTGANGPAVIAGDAVNSLLAHKVLGTQRQGTVMPPACALPQSDIQPLLDWIAAGALDN